MKHQLTSSGGALCLCGILSIAVLFACSKDKAVSTPAPVPNNIRVVTTAKFGKVLTDSAGKTLYFFSNDAGATSVCTGGCAVTWPVFYKDNPTMDTGINKTDFSSIVRTDGAKQLTYKGWPLYYYQPDSAAGDIKGEAVGNVWFVAKPDYSIMISKAQLVGSDGVSYDSTYKAGTQKYAYFTDDLGRTLYSFSPDKFKKNTYTKSDFSNDPTWPIYQVTGVQYIPSIVDKTLFDTVHVFGKVQITFKGWPLYYFGPDNGLRGNTKGVSVPKPGVWPAVNQYVPVAPQ